MSAYKWLVTPNERPIELAKIHRATAGIMMDWAPGRVHGLLSRLAVPRRAYGQDL